MRVRDQVRKIAAMFRIFRNRKKFRKQNAKRKLDKKRLVKKAGEEFVKKALEYAILALIVGISFKVAVVAAPAAAIAKVAARFVIR